MYFPYKENMICDFNLNTYNLELDNDMYDIIIHHENEYYEYNKQILMLYLFFIMYFIVFNCINYLNEENKSFKIGNISVREYYPLLINLRQKANHSKYKDKIFLYLSRKNLRVHLRKLINNKFMKNVNVNDYYISIQNIFSEYLFHYGNKEHKKIIILHNENKNKNYRISVGELNYLIWTIDTKLYDYGYTTYNNFYFLYENYENHQKNNNKIYEFTNKITYYLENLGNNVNRIFNTSKELIGNFYLNLYNSIEHYNENNELIFT